MMDDAKTKPLERRWAPGLLFPWALSLVTACGGGSTKPDDPKIAAPPDRMGKVTIVRFDMADGLGRGGYVTVAPEDFRNDILPNDILASRAPGGFSAETEEAVAGENAIFRTGQGFLLKVDPPQGVYVTLRRKDGSAELTVRREPKLDGRIAASLLAFGDLYPPSFREVYELKVASDPKATLPFSRTFTFSARASGVDPVFAVVEKGDGKPRLGVDGGRLLIARVKPNDSCRDCRVTVENPVIRLTMKNVTELPALDSTSDLRITFPRRFAGILVKTVNKEVPGIVDASSPDGVRIMASIPVGLTAVPSWCDAARGPTCLVRRLGEAAPSYFRFINVIPYDAAEKSLGSVSGVASLTLSGKATVVVKRDGSEIERKEVPLDGGTALAIDSPLLPPWAIDDVRNALQSGAPEFSR